MIEKLSVFILLVEYNITFLTMWVKWQLSEQLFTRKHWQSWTFEMILLALNSYLEAGNISESGFLIWGQQTETGQWACYRHWADKKLWAKKHSKKIYYFTTIFILLQHENECVSSLTSRFFTFKCTRVHKVDLLNV